MVDSYAMGSILLLWFQVDCFPLAPLCLPATVWQEKSRTQVFLRVLACFPVLVLAYVSGRNGTPIQLKSRTINLCTWNRYTTSASSLASALS